MTAAGRPVGRPAEHRCGARPASRGLPGRHDLQDPVPGVGRAGPDRPVPPPGTGSSPQRDVERLRFVLAAQRDHYLPLKVIKEQLDAADAGRRRVPPVLRAVPADGLPTAEDFVEQPIRRMTREELLESAGIDIVDAGASSSSTAWSGRVRPACTTRSRRRSPRPRRRWPSSASNRGTCGVSVRPPTGRSGWSSRSWRRCTGSTRRARGRADETVRELAALSVGLHTLLVKAGLRRIAGQVS